jgi:hypothetical protein
LRLIEGREADDRRSSSSSGGDDDDYRRSRPTTTTLAVGPNAVTVVIEVGVVLAVVLASAHGRGRWRRWGS